MKNASTSITEHSSFQAPWPFFFSMRHDHLDMIDHVELRMLEKVGRVVGSPSLTAVKLPQPSTLVFAKFANTLALH
jgi:hypothetical protein